MGWANALRPKPGARRALKGAALGGCGRTNLEKGRMKVGVLGVASGKALLGVLGPKLVLLEMDWACPV